jgi:hypothetical protein
MNAMRASLRKKILSVRSAFVDQVYVRLDPALVYRPPKNRLGRALTRVGDQAQRSDFELFGRAVEHRLGRSDFRLANGHRRLDVHDHRMLEIDEVVASATIMLASTAKAAPPTMPSFMQRATTVSNSLRNRSLSRKRPWRFFENVE